ncbi:MAG: DUF92 domain-containing protein, partial [Thermoplasmata archaeon]
MMMLPWELAGAGILVTLGLAAAAVAARALTGPAGALAAVFGSVIVVLGGFPYLALLALFVLASGLATRYRFEEKRRRHLQEGRRGERGISNVLAHVIVPTALVVLAVAEPRALPADALPLLYTAAIAFGGADTFASEFGVLAGHARSLLTGRPVPPGTNGGVSATGQLWALVGAGTTAAVAGGLFLLAGNPSSALTLLLVGATAAGFLSCQVDSLLGEILENRGLLSKGGTNLLGMLSSVALAAGF